MVSDGRVVVDADIELGDAEKALKKLESVTTKSAKEIDKTISGAGKAFSGVAREADKAAASIADIDIEPSTAGIKAAEKELASLNSEYEAQLAIVRQLEQDWDAAAQSAHGYTGFADTIKDQLDKATASLDATAKKSWELEDAIGATRNQMDDGAKAAQKLKDEQKQLKDEQKAGEAATRALETAMNAFVTKVLAQAISGMDRLVESTYGFRQEMAMVETNLSKMGSDMEKAEGYMKDLSAVSSDTSVNMGAVSNLLATGFDGGQMEKAIEAISGAVIAFPDQNLQRLAEGIQRSFGEGKAVSNFAELIKRTGGDVDKFNEKMERANSDTQKQNLIMRELSRMGLSDTLEAYKALNPEMVTASEATYDLNAAQAKLGESLQPVKNWMDDIKASVANMAAEFIEAHPEVAKAAVVLAAAGTALMGLYTASKLVSGVFGGLPALFGGAAKNAGNVGKSIGDAGSAAKGANMEFLSVGAGVAIMAAGFAVAILAVSELVKAFGGSGSEAIKIAAAVGIITLAVTVMLGAMTLLSNIVGKNSAQFLVYSAAILVLSAAFSIMILAIAHLVKTLDGSDVEVEALARAISEMLLTMTLAISVIAMLGMVVQKALPGLALLALALLAVAGAFLAIAEAQKQINYGKLINAGINPYSPRGYATGTQSATSGYRWVGENGPELLRFRGGEEVVSRHQAMARQGALSGGGQTVKNYYVGTISIPADNVKSFVKVVDIMENEAGSIQQGFVGG